MTKPSARRHAVRVLLAPLVAALVFFAFPRGEAALPGDLAVGSIAAQDVIAPVRVVLLKSDAERARDAERAALAVRPLVVHTPESAVEARLAADRFFAVLDSALAAGASPAVAVGASGLTLPPAAEVVLARAADRARVRTAVFAALARSAPGVLPPGVFRSELGPEVVLRSSSAERVVPSDSLTTFDQLLVPFTASIPGGRAAESAFAPLLGSLFRPTLVYDRLETEQRRAALRHAVDSVEAVVQAGQKIVGAHEVVTPEAARRLTALRAELARSGVGRANTLLATTGALGLNTLIVGLFGVILLFYRPEVYRSFRSLATFAAGFATAGVAAGMLARHLPERIELIPVALPTILFAILFDARIAAVAAMAIAVLIGAQPSLRGTDALVFCFVGGVAAALSLGQIRSRTRAYGSIAIVAAIYAAAAAVSGAAANEPLRSIGVSASLGGVNALGSAALAMLLLPLLEHATRITTDLRLLELSDPNRPLLRRLATEAPGTYAHSIAMANLCEAACNAIGANGLLARVGCYYHDVGKLANPHVFAENIGRGKNPHDQLAPAVSAAIIRRHVEDGLDLARKGGLPEVLRRFIPEHHGTQEISFFLDRARESGAALQPDLYRYPGPRPQSAETAVALLADAVEAALRVLDDPSAETVRDAIDHLVEKRIESGQLRDAPLTLKQIEIVKREFFRVLSANHHQRIEYPEDAGGITADWETSRAG